MRKTILKSNFKKQKGEVLLLLKTQRNFVNIFQQRPSAKSIFIKRIASFINLLNFKTKYKIINPKLDSVKDSLPYYNYKYNGNHP